MVKYENRIWHQNITYLKAAKKYLENVNQVQSTFQVVDSKSTWSYIIGPSYLSPII